nr:putative mitochondrial protein [Tanacetum cinerariifolium]
MIGSLMYLTASRPDIMFAVYACDRHQVTPKECHLHAVKRIFRYLEGHLKLGLWQYTRRARIAQSSALPPVAYESASPLRDVSQGKACPTVSSLDAEQDRANIAKTSTLPHESTSRELEITMLKARVKLLKDKEGGVTERSGDDAPIKRRRLDEGEEATKKGSNDTEKMINVLTSMDAATVLSSGVAKVSSGSGSIPTVGPPAAGVPTGSDVVPTATPIFATVVTPYTRRKGKEKMIVSEILKKKKIQEQMDIQMARQLEEEMEREAQRMNEQISRDTEIARIHAEEELQIMIDGLDRSNETIAKYLQEYHQFATELPIERRIELISDLVRYQDNYANVHKYQTQQRKPLTKKQQKEFYTSVLRNQTGCKAKDFKGMTVEEIKENFDLVWKQIHDFIPIGIKEEAERFKRKRIRFEQESVKLKTSEEVKATEEVPEEKVKDMIQLIPVEEVYVEALQVKHPIIDWKCEGSGTPTEPHHTPSPEAQHTSPFKKEKEGLDGKLAGFQTASKDLDNLLESQRLDKNKEGLGYSVVPPPPAQLYSSPQKDLSWTGLPEFKNDTVTDYNRPAPTVKSSPDDAQNKNSSVTKEASPSTISPKSFIKFVKANDSPTKSKIDKAEKTKKSPIKYAKQYRKPKQKPNVRGNQRNWNNLKSHQLGLLKDVLFGCLPFIFDLTGLMGGTNSTNLLGTKDAASQEVKKDVSSLRYIALPNWFHDALLESSSSKPQDDCSTDVPESSGNSNPTATSTNPPADPLETLTMETPIPTISSRVPTACFTDSLEPSSDVRLISKRVANQVETPSLDNILTTVNNADPLETLTTEIPIPTISSRVPTACFTDSLEPSSDVRLISKRVANQVETPSLDNILTLANRFEDILGVTTNSDESNGVEADVEAMQEELLQFKIQNVWTLVDCPKG